MPDFLQMLGILLHQQASIVWWCECPFFWMGIIWGSMVIDIINMGKREIGMKIEGKKDIFIQWPTQEPSGGVGEGVKLEAGQWGDKMVSEKKKSLHFLAATTHEWIQDIKAGDIPSCKQDVEQGFSKSGPRSLSIWPARLCWFCNISRLAYSILVSILPYFPALWGFIGISSGPLRLHWDLIWTFEEKVWEPLM